MPGMYLELAEDLGGSHAVVNERPDRSNYTFVPVGDSGYYVRNDKLSEMLSKKKGGGFFKKAIQFKKKLALAPFRRSARTLIAINFHGMAKKLMLRITKGGEAKLRSKWEKMGGKYSELVKSIKAGAKRKAFLDGLEEDRMIADCANQFPEMQKNIFRNVKQQSGMSEGETLGAVQIAAVVAAAAPIIAAIFGGKGKKAKDAGAVPGEDEIGTPAEKIIATVKSIATAAGVPDDIVNADPSSPAAKDKFEKDEGKDDAPIKDKDGKIFGLPKAAVIGGGIGLTALAFIATRKQ